MLFEFKKWVHDTEGCICSERKKCRSHLYQSTENASDSFYVHFPLHVDERTRAEDALRRCNAGRRWFVLGTRLDLEEIDATVFYYPCKGVDLRRKLAQGEGWTHEDRLAAARDMVRSTQQLHAEHVYHPDFNLGNVLWVGRPKHTENHADAACIRLIDVSESPELDWSDGEKQKALHRHNVARCIQEICEPVTEAPGATELHLFMANNSWPDATQLGRLGLLLDDTSESLTESLASETPPLRRPTRSVILGIMALTISVAAAGIVYRLATRTPVAHTGPEPSAATGDPVPGSSVASRTPEPLSNAELASVDAPSQERNTEDSQPASVSERPSTAEARRPEGQADRIPPGPVRTTAAPSPPASERTTSSTQPTSPPLVPDIAAPEPSPTPRPDPGPQPVNVAFSLGGSPSPSWVQLDTSDTRYEALYQTDWSFTQSLTIGEHIVHTWVSRPSRLTKYECRVDVKQDTTHVEITCDSTLCWSSHNSTSAEPCRF